MAHILVTDDATSLRKVLGDMLVKLGHTYDEACDGAEALAKCKNSQYDLVTLDITMPNMDGLSALKAIKEINPNQKCVMISAMDQQAIVVDAVKSGASDFIVKPFEHERVNRAISKLVG